MEAWEYGACANPYVQWFETDSTIHGDVPSEYEEHVLLVLAYQSHLWRSVFTRFELGHRLPAAAHLRTATEQLGSLHR